MKFTSILALVGAAAANDRQHAADLHEQMAAFVTLIDAVSAKDEDLIYNAVSERKNALKANLNERNAKTVTREFRSLLNVV